jgi:hypothetical protein
MTMRNELAVVWDAVAEGVAKARAGLVCGGVPAPDWVALQVGLEALPLTTEDYGVCLNELLHARQYLEAGERGAAWYELKLLEGRLRLLRGRLGW